MPFEILPYSKPNLISLLNRSSLADLHSLENDQHVEYFDRYLSDVGTQSIVCESGYIDRDYLEDYAHYYVKCFPDYERKCTRLHFFNSAISEDDLVEILSNFTEDSHKTISDAYLGFAIVKRLPQTIFGRTCLKTYEGQGRYFPTLQNYKIHLFGIPLSQRSLPFQEQDQVAAACATSCLWSIFHATGKLFQHRIPSPVEITNAATSQMPAQTRVFPNNSLNVEQMAQAIRHVGLEPHFVSVLNQDYLLKSTLYAYSRGGIPSALIVYLVDTSNHPHVVDPIQHAIAVCGYRLSGAAPTAVGGTGVLSIASTIDKIYCHDDQIGPFARMEFDGVTVEILNGSLQQFPSISTSWKGVNGVVGSKRAVANLLLIPLYHKIRIPIALIEQPVFDFDALVEELRANGLISLPQRIVWDIFLQQQNGYKNEILCTNHLDPKDKSAIATSHMPRFLWRAQAICEDRPILDLLFDATDIAQSGCFHNKLIYDQGFFNELVGCLSSPIIMSKALRTRACNIIKSFIP